MGGNEVLQCIGTDWRRDEDILILVICASVESRVVITFRDYRCINQAIHSGQVCAIAMEIPTRDITPDTSDECTVVAIWKLRVVDV